MHERWSGQSTAHQLKNIVALHEKLVLDDVPMPPAKEASPTLQPVTTATFSGAPIPSPPSLSGSPTKFTTNESSTSNAPSIVLGRNAAALTRANVASVSIKGRAEGGSTKLSPLEKEFQQAVEELYLDIGGADYRKIAHESVAALETVLRIFREGITIAKAVGPLVAQKELAKAVDSVQVLLAEAKAFVGPDGSKLHSAAAGAALMESKEPKKADAQELYDVGVLVAEYGTNSRDAAHEDEVHHLRHALQSVTLERNNLQQTADQQEKQLQMLRTKIQKECDAMIKQKAVLAEQVQALQDRFPPVQAAAAGGGGAETPHDGMLPSPPRAARGLQQRPPSSEAEDSAFTTGQPNAFQLLSLSPVATSGVAEASNISASSASGGTPAGAAASAVNNSKASRDVMAPSESRYNKIESLYADVYSGKGMELIWGCLDCVFKREYDEGDSNSTFGPNGGYSLFRDEFHKTIVKVVDNEAEFRENICNVTPLRAEYVANCLGSHVKPNSGVVKLLSTIHNDRDVEELSLRGNYIGDQGIQPLISIFMRLYRLKSLDLADNGIKNGGVHVLTQALARHPSLTSLNIGHNNVSRAAGKDVLGLLGVCPKLRHVDITGTDIDKALSERILARAQLNATAIATMTPIVSSPSGVSEGGGS